MRSRIILSGKANTTDNEDFRFRNLLGLDLTAAEAASADGSWQTEVTNEPLYLKADQFFLKGKSYEPCRKPSDFIKALNAVFQIAKDRSSINKAIISLVDKPNKDAPFTYPFAQCAYIAYTATPYACILNERPDQTELYADFIATIEKSPQYFGLDEIYGRNLKSAKARMDVIRSIPEGEKDMIIDPLVSIHGAGKSKKKDAAHEREVEIKEDLSCKYEKKKDITWQSLKDAVAWTFCCAAARRFRHLEMLESIVDEGERAEMEKEIGLRWTTMLFNIHQNTKVHGDTAKILESYLNWIFKDGESVAAFVAECAALWKKETARFDVAS